MWIKSYSNVYQRITKEAIWHVWADVNNWPKWDEELEYCKGNDAFTDGSRLILKPKAGPKVTITLSEVVPNKRFTNYCKFLGAIMYVAHDLEETSNGLSIKHTVTVKGPLAFIWVKLVAKNVANAAPNQIDALVDLARVNKIASGL